MTIRCCFDCLKTIINKKDNGANNMDNTNNQRRAIAALESQVDLLEAELLHLNEMLVRCGFPEGISTLKETVAEYLQDSPCALRQGI